MDVKNLGLGASVILMLAACSPGKSADSVFAQSNTCGGQAVENRFIVSWEDGTVSVEKSADADTFKRDFVEPNLKRIRKVERDVIVQLVQPAVRSSAFLTQTWGQDMTEVADVWNAGVKGQGVVVGVVDSFVDISHPQLSPRIAVNAGEIPNNGIDDDGNGYVDDVYGTSFIPGSPPGTVMNAHGTHVSGIIAADPARGAVKGIAPAAKLVPVPFITNDGTGSLGDAIKAMQYTASRGATVINASWGGPSCLSAMRDAMFELGRRGVVIVVAAGNDSDDIDAHPTYPASFGLENQITVAANTSSDLMAWFSNSGFNLVHLAAPGEDIYSTVPGGYDLMSGTSMAAPFVTGAVALLKSARPNATVAQIRKALFSSVDSAEYHRYRVSTGGRLNVRKAYQELIRLAP